MCNNSHNYADNLDSRLEEYTAEIKQLGPDNSRHVTAPTLIDILNRIASIPIDGPVQAIIHSLAQSIYDYYVSGARHSYAEIFIFLRDLQADSNDINDIIEKLELIDLNTERLRDYISQHSKEFQPSEGINVDETCQTNFDIILRYFKLRDHILLETARIRFWYDNNRRIEDNIKNLSKNVDASKTKAEEVKQLTETALDEVKTFRTTQVTILTAFIAILLMVVTDIKFTASMINAIGKVPLYQIALLTAFGAFITLNLSFALLVFIANIIDKNLMVNCNDYIPKDKFNDNSKRHCAYCNESCDFLVRFWKRYAYMCYMNIILVLIMIIIICNNYY